MKSTDPDFETKAADGVGLYIAPPQHAAVFCVDEKAPALRLVSHGWNTAVHESACT
jgi:hypothetical protein